MKRLLGLLLLTAVALITVTVASEQSSQAATWKSGTPISLRGGWSAPNQLSGDKVYENRALLIDKSSVMFYFNNGNSGYLGGSAAYHYSKGAYLIRTYNSKKKIWYYTTVKKGSKTLVANQYGYKKSGNPFKAHVTTKLVFGLVGKI